MFNLYSSWDKYRSVIEYDEDRTIKLASFNQLDALQSSFRSIENKRTKSDDNLSSHTLQLPDSMDTISLQLLDRSQSNQNIAVECKDVSFKYGNGQKAINVLKDINLSVPEGSIYGLLGPSGCGKTSLLKCFVGRLKPVVGDIKIFGKTPGEAGSKVPGSSIGYMPQELALFPDFTIEETLCYFGRLCLMDTNLIPERTKFLLKFLDLPNNKRLVGNLSGGQMRRVSLAAALIHNPPLLILDEPTVGADPLLRQCIWDYLVSLSINESLTVIITTHYIEEARAANFVGLMRFGTLLIEENPDNLLRHYNFPTLEEVFLKLCELDAEGINVSKHYEEERSNGQNLDNCNEKSTSIRQSDNISDNLLEVTNNENGSTKYESKPLQIEVNKQISKISSKHDYRADTLADSIARISALSSKNFIRLRRNLPVLLFQFLLPSIQVILFCTCIGKDPFDIPLAVFNQEQPPQLSELFLNTIDNHTILQRHYYSFDSAINSVKDGEAWGALVIGQNFSSALQMRVLMNGDVDNATVMASYIHLYPDMTSQMISYKLYETIVKSFIKFAKELLYLFNQSTSSLEIPVVLEEPIYGNRTPNFTEFMAPGVILSIAFLASVALTALAFIMERKEGLLERSLVAGASSTEFMVSHVLTQFLVLTVQVACLLIFSFAIFGITSRGSFVWVISLTLLQATCGMAFGLMISALCTEENSATMLALGSFYPNLLLSGTVWPTQAMPASVRYFSYILPQTIPIEAFRYILSRGWDIQYSIVALGFTITIIWILFFLISAVIIFKLKK